MISGAEIVILLIFLCIWLFSAYILYKIAKKFDVKKSYWWYLIPFYNNWLIMKPVGLSPWLILGFFIPYISIIIYAYIWGQIAKKLAKNPWLYGLTIVLLGLPIIILAFDNSQKIDSAESVFELYPESNGLPIIKVKEFETITVGRDKLNEIVIDNKYLSSRHIDIYAQSGEVFITDLGTSDSGSTNGSYINGMKLIPSHPTKLNKGEQLILGSEDVVYFLQ